MNICKYKRLTFDGILLLLWPEMPFVVFFVLCYKHTGLTIVDCERFTFWHPTYRDYHLYWYIMTI
jgi:hypothetical protein